MAFGALIQQMLSAQNEQRQAAEAVFAEVKSNADLTVTNLLGLLKQSPNTESRAFCAVMLRKVAILTTPFKMLFQLSYAQCWSCGLMGVRRTCRF